MSTSPQFHGFQEPDVIELYEREHDTMVRLAALLTGSGAIAEEVVHDAFLGLTKHWETVDQPGGYLRRSVVNGCAQVLRRRDTHRRAQSLLARPEAYELHTRLVELASALDQLTKRQRTVIVLRYFVDLPDTEIADLIDCRPATVRSLASRALTILRKELS